MVVTQKYVNQLAYRIVGCAIEVHKQLGPGLLESVYETCLIDELIASGLKTEKHILVPLLYKGKELGCNLVLDLLVEDLVIIELKSVETMIPVYKAQLLSYLELTGKPKGLLINFNCLNIKGQLVPLVTDQFAILPKE
ncbi:MAG: GxxExxY protein [Ignavibacteriaceae bacterium]|nr:GxxExxY protein [Ignavibacteriaceae bacterium]